MRPSHPIYIPSKGRAATATTPDVLDSLGVPFRLIVEDSQHDEYAARFGADRLLVLPESFIDDYETFYPLEPGRSKGSGPARNFAWEHSLGEGHPWHWIMDDNIYSFARFHRNRLQLWGDGTPFAAMEDFTSRYLNVAMAGPQYFMFVYSSFTHALVRDPNWVPPETNPYASLAYKSKTGQSD